VCLPAYEKDKPAQTIADRRASLMGYILGVFRPADMIESALAKLQPEGIDVGLYDPSDTGNKGQFHVHASRARPDGEKPSDLFSQSRSRYTVHLNISGHHWIVVCTSTPEFEAAHTSLWPWGVFVAGLAATGMLAAYLLLSIGHTVTLEDKVREQTENLRLAQDEVIWRVISASRWSDDESEMHMKRIGLLSEVVASAAGWFGEELDAIRQAAPLHDVGKIGIPDAILQKPEKLTPVEQEIMKTHTLVGGEILAGSKMPMLRMARDIALNHHERWDGLGYPRGIAGKKIPESARIVAIVDTFDALTHERVYRPAMTEDEALAIVRQGADTHFDPRLLAHFFRRLPEIRKILAEHPDDDRKPPTKGQITTEAAAPPTTLMPSFELPSEVNVPMSFTQ
jgi:HD-GYP domain-containing protein (c-di-GMP phosphodiesterase class II)